MSDTMIEAWRPVRGLEDLYEVSDQGNVRSLRFINGATNKERDVPLVLQPHRDKKDGRFLILGKAPASAIAPAT